jgi:hypothetical protein
MQQSEGISPITSRSTLPIDKLDQGKVFINRFCDDVQEYLTNGFHYVNFSQEQNHSRKLFLEQMKEGVATLEDTGDICRAVCVSIQAAIEMVLKLKLEKKELTHLEVLFLTGLPCTPLRKELQQIDTTKENEWKKWTVDIRTQTVREMRSSGANIQLSYFQEQYKALAESNKSEFETYAREKAVQNTQDIPLLATIPSELIGALYTFTDREGITYKIATQGIQIQHHGEITKEQWKKWFGIVGSGAEVEKRAEAMESFVSQNRIN